MLCARPQSSSAMPKTRAIFLPTAKAPHSGAELVARLLRGIEVRWTCLSFMARRHSEGFFVYRNLFSMIYAM